MPLFVFRLVKKSVQKCTYTQLFHCRLSLATNRPFVRQERTAYSLWRR